MRVLLISEDRFIFDENSPNRAKILKYASLVNTFFIIVANSIKKNSNLTTKIANNTWLYENNSSNIFIQAYRTYKLASFELSIKRVFQVDLIICEDVFLNALSGYFLARKFKKPLYLFFSEKNEGIFFAPIGIKNYLLSKILWFVLKRANFIKVNNFTTKEKLLKKYSTLEIEVIKPFLDVDALINKYNNPDVSIVSQNNSIINKFPRFRFTAIVYVDNLDQVKQALETLRAINKYSTQISLMLLHSNNLNYKKINHLIGDDLKPFLYVEALGEDLCEYLINTNVFWGISEGEKYEEVLSKAFILGSKIIAIESDIAEQLINNNVTGFICPNSSPQQESDYFVDKTLTLINNPVLGTSFKINRPENFRQQFNTTREEYENKLKTSLEKCVSEYRANKK